MRRWRAGQLLVVAAAAIGGVLATRDDGPPPRVSISQAAIAGATLGQTEKAYKQLYGPGWRSDVLTEPNFPALIFVYRKQSIYFDPDTRRSIIVTTWNPEHRTAAGVGPCSSLEELEVGLRQRAEAVPLEHAEREGSTPTPSARTCCSRSTAARRTPRSA